MKIVTAEPDRTHNTQLCFFHFTLSIRVIAEVGSILPLFSVKQSYLEILPDTNTALDTAIILAIGYQ